MMMIINYNTLIIFLCIHISPRGTAQKSLKIYPNCIIACRCTANISYAWIIQLQTKIRSLSPRYGHVILGTWYRWASAGTLFWHVSINHNMEVQYQRCTLSWAKAARLGRSICWSISAMLHDVIVGLVTRHYCRIWSHRSHTNHAAGHVNHKKELHARGHGSVPIVTLGGPSGRRGSAGRVTKKKAGNGLT